MIFVGLKKQREHRNSAFEKRGFLSGFDIKLSSIPAVFYLMNIFEGKRDDLVKKAYLFHKRQPLRNEEESYARPLGSGGRDGFVGSH